MREGSRPKSQTTRLSPSLTAGFKVRTGLPAASVIRISAFVPSSPLLRPPSSGSLGAGGLLAVGDVLPLGAGRPVGRRLRRGPPAPGARRALGLLALPLLLLVGQRQVRGVDREGDQGAVGAVLAHELAGPAAADPPRPRLAR